MATKQELPAQDFTVDLVQGNVNNAKKSAGAEVGQLLMVPPEAIRPIPGFNVRVKTQDYLDHKNEIAASIRANGFFPNKPLGGYVAKEDGKDVFYLTDGYTRLDAVNTLNDPEFGDGGDKVEKVPFVVKPQGQNLEDLTIALVQDNEGRPLSVYEKAVVVARLKSYNMENVEIARRLGMTDRYVGDLLLLAGAPVKVRNLVIQGKVSATEAVKQLRKDAKGAGEKLTKATDAATAAGKKKATNKDVAKAGGASTSKKDRAPKTTATPTPPTSPPGKVVDTQTFVFKAGSTLEADEIKPVARVADAAWWNYIDDTKAHVFIEEDIEIAVTTVRNAPASTETETTDDTFATGDEPVADVEALGTPAPDVDTGDL